MTTYLYSCRLHSQHGIPEAGSVIFVLFQVHIHLCEAVPHEVYYLMLEEVKGQPSLQKS